ncbi:MAG: histidine kinase [Paludibacter sp.]
MRTQINPYKISINLVSCFGLLMLPLIGSPRASVFDSLSIGSPEITGLIGSALLILYYYANYYVFIPRLFLQKKYILWSIIAITSFLFVLFVPHLFSQDIEIHQELKSNFPGHFHPHFHGGFRSEHHSFYRSYQFQETLLKFIVVFVLSLLLRTRELWKQSQKEKRDAELSFLKSQVNPHFLFNTLNGIYALSLEESKKTPDAIVKLSELMRYVISEINKDVVPLKNEIYYLQNYIDLQKLRLEDTVDVKFEISNFKDELQIAPLLLIPFVENAFKYGVNPESNSYIEIKLLLVENEMEFSVTNKKVALPNLFIQNGTGLANVKRRLVLMYPAAYKLQIDETEQDYGIKLNLKLS